MFSDITSVFRLFHTSPFQTDSSILPTDLAGSIGPLSNLITELNTGYKIFGVVVSLAIALLCCFFGYKFSRMFMGLTGAIAGGIAGYMLATHVFHMTGLPVALVTVIGIIVLASLAAWIYMAGIFILCFFLSFSAAASLIPLTGDIAFFVCTLIGIGIAGLALKFLRPVIIIISAIVGGSSSAGLLITAGTYLDFGIFSSLPSKMVLTLTLCVLGILVQFLTTSDPVKRKRPKHNR